MNSDRKFNARFWPYVFLFGGILLLALEIKSVYGHIGSDYRIFYNAAIRFNSNPLDLYMQDSARTLQGFLYPPPAVLLFLPFSTLPLGWSYTLFTVLLYFSAFISIAVWANLGLLDGSGFATSRFGRANLMLLTATSGPFFAAVAAGQVDILVLLVCVVHIALIMQGRPVLGGLVLAVGFWIKIYPAALLAYAFFRPNTYRILIGFLLGLMIVPLLSAPIVPIQLYGAYFFDLLPKLSSRTIVNIYNQSLSAFCVRLGLPLSVSTDSFMTYTVPDSIRRSVVIGGIAVMAGIAASTRFVKSPVMPLVAMILAMFAIIAPLGWGHTYVYVLPLIYSTWLMGRQTRSKVISVFVVLVYLVMLVPTYKIFPLNPDVPELAYKIVYSRYLFSTIFLLIVAAFLVRINCGKAGQLHRLPLH